MDGLAKKQIDYYLTVQKRQEPIWHYQRDEDKSEACAAVWSTMVKPVCIPRHIPGRPASRPAVEQIDAVVTSLQDPQASQGPPGT